MKSIWNVESLKAHFDELRRSDQEAVNIALAAVKESNQKAEIAAEKRFELLNELRGGVATKDEVKALEKVVEDLKQSRDQGTGRGLGLSQGWGILIAVIGIAFAIWSRLS